MSEPSSVAPPYRRHTMFVFQQFNPVGPDQYDFAALLRRAADHLEQIGDVEVYDVVMNPPLDLEDDDRRPSITVYYDDRRVDEDDDRPGLPGDLPATFLGPVPLLTSSTPGTRSFFEQSNPRGPGQRDVPALLRRVADTIEQLGEIEVHDLVLHPRITRPDGEDQPSIVVYYSVITSRSG